MFPVQNEGKAALDNPVETHHSSEPRPSPSPGPQSVPWDRRDLFIAVGMAIFALVVYVRVLAPDVLYSDSGEFQTLAYTWGTTHTTGYPVYLILARIIGLLPINTPAWRINFASAFAAALTLGALYLIARHFTQRGGAILTSLVLLVSYTFWSQSIIAEVYTPALAFICAVLLALLVWCVQPLKRRWLLFLTGFLLTLGVGVHLFLMLIAPAVFAFVLWGIVWGPPEECGHWKHILLLGGGAAAGALTFYMLFAFIDTRPTPTNIFTTAIYPSRDVWGLQDSDLDSVPKRFWISVSGYQWRSRMLPNDVDYQKTLREFFRETLPREYATPTLLLAILGGLVTLVRQRRLFALIGTGLVVTFTAGLVYFPGDKYIFYLPFYLLLAIFAGAGAGSLMAWITRLVPAVIPRAVPPIIMTVILVAVCVAPFIATRWKSAQLARSGFITEDYVFPVTNPNEARRKAECALAQVPESDAFLVLDWRALYSIYYVAYVEDGRTGIIIREALPYPAKVITPDLRAEIQARLDQGEAVYVDDLYDPLNNFYSLTPVSGGCLAYKLYRVAAKG